MGLLTTSEEQHHYWDYPMAPFELETVGCLVGNDSRHSQNDEREANDDSVDDLAEFVFHLVYLVEPIHDGQYQQYTASTNEELHCSGVENIRYRVQLDLWTRRS